MRRGLTYCILITLLIIVLLGVSLLVGAVDIPADKKFMIYKDIIMLTEDKACIEPAYNAARQILDEKAKGEALVYIVECIDKLGIQMSIGGDQ